MEKDVNSQLKGEKLLSEQEKAIGFVLCGKTHQDNKFRIKELFWSFKEGRLNFQFVPHLGLVKTGVGQNHLEDYVNDDKGLGSIDYWKNMSVEQAKSELKRLFLIAVKEQRRVRRKDFSDTYDIDCIVK